MTAEDANKMLERLIFKARSYRRFHQKEKINPNFLKDLVNLARLTPSAANLQPLKFMISAEEEKNALIFPCLKWAAYLEGWGGPEEGERPSAYIVVLQDTSIAKNPGCDHGLAAQTIMLGAVAAEYGGCVIASIDKEQLRRILSLDGRMEILLVLALGRPKERVVLENITDGNVRYWRDKNNVHHVPKRPLDEVLLPWPEEIKNLKCKM
jgi:nitroreductase